MPDYKAMYEDALSQAMGLNAENVKLRAENKRLTSENIMLIRRNKILSGEYDMEEIGNDIKKAQGILWELINYKL